MSGKKYSKVDGAASQIAGKSKSIVIEQPMRLQVGLEVEGTADLIVNKFSQKTLEQMLRKHMGLTVQRENKVPAQVIQEARVLNVDGRDCLSPMAFKLAMLTAATGNKTLKKTQLRIGMYVRGNSIPITSEKVTARADQPAEVVAFSHVLSRMDMVRTAGPGHAPDIRFRPSFVNWKARMIIEYKDMFDVQSIVDLLNRAGDVGVGEWRPEKNGTFGTFRVSRHISDPDELAEVENECAVPLERLVIPDWAMNVEIDPVLLSKIANSAHGHTDVEEAV